MAVSTVGGKNLAVEVVKEMVFQKKKKMNRCSPPVCSIYRHSSNQCTDSGVSIYSLLNSNYQVALCARHVFCSLFFFDMHLALALAIHEFATKHLDFSNSPQMMVPVELNADGYFL